MTTSAAAAAQQPELELAARCNLSGSSVGIVIIGRVSASIAYGTPAIVFACLSPDSFNILFLLLKFLLSTGCAFGYSFIRSTYCSIFATSRGRLLRISIGTMFASYLFSRQHQYSPLPSENKSELPASSENHGNRRRIFIQAFFVLETIHLIIVLLAYAGGHVLEHAHAHRRHELDNCMFVSKHEFSCC